MRKLGGDCRHWRGARLAKPFGASNGAAPPPYRPAPGRRVKTLFTLCRAARIGCGMVIFAALALSVTPADPPPPVRIVAAERQAQAMVRILPGAALRFAEIEQSAPETLRDTQVRTPDGTPEPARLIEFH